MCGIAGYWGRGGPAPAEAARSLSFGVRHRGPDDEGLYEDRRAGIALAQRRLAVIDLDPRSRCPLPNEDETVWITFNGEIYNFAEIRDDLVRRGHRFRSEGDAETIVHLWEDSGPACVERLRGMFAFALWDSRTRTLFLARDRVGKKPLHYARTPDFFAFASEIEPLAALPGVPRDIDLEALDEYLTFQYVPSPRTIYRSIRKLPPGCRAIVRQDGIRVERYWELEYEPKREIDPDTAARELRRGVDEAVRLRLISDVPLGAFLSGGLDSSAVVASMAAQTSRPVKTYSIGFDEREWNELPYARSVARRFGCDHHEAVVRPDALSLLPSLVRRYGEPFADASAIPTWYVSEFARRDVTVVLNGDGGDECFAGYDRYRADRIVHLWRRLPRVLRRGVFLPVAERMPHRAHPRSLLRRVRRFIRAVEGSPDTEAPARTYLQWIQFFSDEAKAELYSDALREELRRSDPGRRLVELYASARARDPLDRTLSVDVRSYLPDDLLVKVDIASMAHGLEARSPLLDHVLMEWAARLPVRYKLRGLRTKWLLRRAYRGILPDEILDRGKMGFGVPLERWFRVELRTFVRDLLLSPEARARGLFRPEAVARLLDDHAEGRADHSYRLWALVMLEAWNRIFVDRRESL